MAQVATVSSPTVQESGAPLSINPPADAFGVAGAGLGELGKAEEGASDMLAKHAEAFQAINNKMAADQASIAAAGAIDKMGADYRANNAGSAMYQNLPQFYSDVEAKRQEFGQGLSPMAKADFDQSSRFYTFRTLSQTTNEAASARKEQMLKTTDDVTSLAGQAFLTNPTPETEANFHKTLGEQAALLSTPAGAGFNDAQRQTWMLSHISPVYAGLVKQAYDQGDINKANQLLDQHKSDMTIEDYDKVSGGLRVADHANAIQSTALAIVNGGNVVAPGTAGPEAVWSAVKTQESGNQPGVVNPASGTQGIAQLEPGTAQEMAAKLGVPWKPELMTAKTPEGAAYQEQLGKAYFDQGLRAENGDIPRALEYYYGGPDESQWGPKTQAYRDQVLARLGGASPAQSFPPLSFDPKVDPALTLANADTEVLRRSAQAFPNDPVAQHQAYEASMQWVHARVGQIDASQKAVFDDLFNKVTQGNIGDPTAMQALDPTAWAALPPKYKSSLEAQTRYQGDKPTEERSANEVQLNGLLGYAGIDPSLFINADIRAMDLTQGTKQKMLDAQAKLKSGALQPDGLVGGIVKTQEFKSAFNAITSGEDTATSNTHFAEFTGALKEEMDAWRQQNPNKNPQPADIQGIIANVTAMKGKTWLSKGTPAFEYPKDAEASLMQAATALGQPTDPRTLAQLYWHAQRRQARAGQ